MRDKICAELAKGVWPLPGLAGDWSVVCKRIMFSKDMIVWDRKYVFNAKTRPWAFGYLPRKRKLS
jgi:hypothetical protein